MQVKIDIRFGIILIEFIFETTGTDEITEMECRQYAQCIPSFNAGKEKMKKETRQTLEKGRVFKMAISGFVCKEKYHLNIGGVLTLQKGQLFL